MKKDQVRKLESGDWVIDLGRKWYRVRTNGEVLTKTTTWRKGDLCGSIKSRRATSSEREFAFSAIAKAEG